MAVAERRYEQHRRDETLLHAIVREHLESFLAHAEEQTGKRLPRYVENEFRRYVKCGIAAHGFARAVCSSCGHSLFLAFSCKLRGVCPSCNARRMCNQEGPRCGARQVQHPRRRQRGRGMPLGARASAPVLRPRPAQSRQVSRAVEVSARGQEPLLAENARIGKVRSAEVVERMAMVAKPLTRLDWATLLKRVHDVDALECPKCGGRMRFVEVVEDPQTARALLADAGQPSEPPPLARARAPDWD